MIARLTSTIAAAAVYALSTAGGRDRKARIDFYARRLWNEPAAHTGSRSTPKDAPAPQP